MNHQLQDGDHQTQYDRVVSLCERLTQENTELLAELSELRRQLRNQGVEPGRVPLAGCVIAGKSDINWPRNRGDSAGTNRLGLTTTLGHGAATVSGVCEQALAETISASSSAAKISVEVG